MTSITKEQLELKIQQFLTKTEEVLDEAAVIREALHKQGINVNKLDNKISETKDAFEKVRWSWKGCISGGVVGGAAGGLAAGLAFGGIGAIVGVIAGAIAGGLIGGTFPIWFPVLTQTLADVYQIIKKSL